MNKKISQADFASFAAWAGIGALLLMVVVLILIESVQTANAQGSLRIDFNHNTTGFPLTGEHALQNCDDCHRQGMFKGTPTQCVACHTAGSGRAVTSKPSSHIVTAAPCDQCHTSTSSWTVAHFSHVAVAPGSCATCHNGSTATGKPANHVPTTASCDSCHRTTAWIPAGYDHANVAPGSCATCHNGSTATGKPSGHFVTTRSCDACHTTAAWVPVLNYSHISPHYSTHSGLACTACHTTNSETIAWPYSAYQPDCAGCHAGDFKPDAHKKTESPSTIFYTVSELRNCAGSCHLYTDSSYTTIKESRSGQHRSTDGGF